jgi:helicase required for RNAi-mediated heterochromatin assembly 1
MKGFFSPLQFVDVQSGGVCDETNRYEAEWILLILEYFSVIGEVTSDKVTVLTPYRKQKSLLQQMIHKNGMEYAVHTTDEFQGKENDVVIISLVLTGSSPSPHLRDERRICVMTSRARRSLIFVGKLDTFQKFRFLFYLKNIINENVF